MWIILALLTIHFVADFLLQTDWMALNKSKSNKALLTHTGVYALCFVPFGLQLALITLVLHTLTDYVTSRMTSRLWFFDGDASYGIDANGWVKQRPNGKRHWFFVMIGLDQLLHAWQLILTAHFLGLI